MITEGYLVRHYQGRRGGRGPAIDPEEILRPREEAEFRPEAIGYLTTPVDVPGWVRIVRGRFSFLRDLDDVEGRFSRCSLADERDVRQMIEALGHEK